MYSVTFYQLSKKGNSTKRPTGEGLTLNCTILNDSEVMTPSLRVSTDSPPINYNYAYIPEYLRYYYVSWSYDTGKMWKADLVEDVLATWREVIGVQSLYVLRSSHAYNGNIIDSAYPTTADPVTYLNTTIPNVFSLTGLYIIGVVGSDATSGSVNYYALSRAQFGEFCRFMFDSVAWLNISTSEISEQLQRALINPFQYVVSCDYLPVSRTELVNGGAVSASSINFGWWSCPLSSSALELVPGVHVSGVLSLTIPRHPQAVTRGNYLNVSPFSRYTLTFYPFGSFELDSSALSGWTTCDLHYDVDAVSGAASLRISVNGSANPIRFVTANIAQSIPVAQITADFESLSGGTIAMAAMANLPDIGDFIRGRLRGETRSGGVNLLSTTTAALANVDVQSCTPNLGLINTNPINLTGAFYHVADEDITHMGRPLCEMRVINTIPGFIMCRDAEFDIACNPAERSEIDSALLGGFFYE